MAARSILTSLGEYVLDPANQPVDVRTLLQFTEFVNEISEIFDVNGQRPGQEHRSLFSADSGVDSLIRPSG